MYSCSCHIFPLHISHCSAKTKSIVHNLAVLKEASDWNQILPRRLAVHVFQFCGLLLPELASLHCWHARLIATLLLDWRADHFSPLPAKIISRIKLIPPCFFGQISCFQSDLYPNLLLAITIAQAQPTKASTVTTGQQQIETKLEVLLQTT